MRSAFLAGIRAPRFRASPLLGASCALFLAGAAQAAPPTARPVEFRDPVRNGVADLRSWNGTDEVTLSGTWTFFPGMLRPAATTPSVPLKVPGVWKDALGGTDGVGTYRVVLVFGQTPPPGVGLSVPVIPGGSEVVWNGRTEGKAGRPGLTAADTTQVRRTYVLALEPRPGTNTLEVRASSWHHEFGGFTEPVRLGSDAALRSERDRSVEFYIFLFGALAIMGLYHLGHFGFRTKDHDALWFGVLSLLLGLRGLFYGPVPVQDYLPDLSWEASMRIGYLTFTGPTLFFSLFIRNLFRPVAPRWFLAVVLAGAGGYSLAVLLLPGAVYTALLPTFQAYVAGLGVVVIVMLVRAVARGLGGSVLFLGGFLLFFAAILNDILRDAFFLPTPYLSPLGLLAFLFFQSLVMIRKFTAAFSAVEYHLDEIEQLNVSMERFVPREHLAFLEKKSIREVELGAFTAREMNVMFLDIRGFTALSERMTPFENFQFLNSYLKRLGPVVRRHGGFIDKYLGDGILALFPGRSDAAVACAVDLMKTIDEYNGHRASVGYAALRVGIGIHRGPLMLGTIGEAMRMDSTVISDTVNTASRLEGLTKTFRRTVLLSRAVVDDLTSDLRAAHPVETAGRESVKGKDQPLEVWGLTEDPPFAAPVEARPAPVAERPAPLPGTVGTARNPRTAGIKNVNKTRVRRSGGPPKK